MGEEHQRQMLAAHIGVGVVVLDLMAVSLRSISYILRDGAPVTFDHGVHRRRSTASTGLEG
jgi:hypothetical protein